MRNNLKLKLVNTIQLTPTSPFNFDSTFHKPDHFPTKDTKWKPGKRWQTMLWNGKRLGLIFNNTGTLGKPRMSVYVYSNQKLSRPYLNTLEKELEWRYNLKLDLAEFYRLANKDKHLSPVVKRFEGMRPMHPGSLYEFLVITIVLQNATVKRSVSMLQALFDNYGTLLEYGRVKLFSFWEPKDIGLKDEQKLRNLKLGYRAKSIARLSDQFAKGKINEDSLRSQTQIKQEEELLSIYGVGPASVGYLMFEVFHHWDYLKTISPWEQKIYSKLFYNKDPENPVSEDKLLKHFEKFDNYKQLAVHYIWEDLWWKRKHEHIPWLEKLIRL